MRLEQKKRRNPPWVATPPLRPVNPFFPLQPPRPRFHRQWCPQERGPSVVFITLSLPFRSTLFLVAAPPSPSPYCCWRFPNNANKLRPLQAAAPGPSAAPAPFGTGAPFGAAGRTAGLPPPGPGQAAMLALQQQSAAGANAPALDLARLIHNAEVK